MIAASSSGAQQAYLDNHDECRVVLGKVSDEVVMEKIAAALTLYMCLMGLRKRFVMSWEGAVFVGSGGGVRAGQRLSTSTLMQRPERDVTGVSTFSVIRYAARPDPIIHSVPSHTSGRQLGTWIPGRTHATSGACLSLRARGIQRRRRAARMRLL
jgi:hypothetical protein